MDNIFIINKKQSKTSVSIRPNIFKEIEKSIICSISCNNVIAFSTQGNIEEKDSACFSSNVYVCDLNTPWQVHKILCNSSPITVLQWDFSGELLLLGDENGSVRIYKTKDYVLNEWTLLFQTILQGEHILAAAFFHPGRKVCLNTDKKDAVSYLDKFQYVKFHCSVKQFGGRPTKGVLLLTTTGMLAAILLPQILSNNIGFVVATESLGPTRIYVKTVDICYGKNGHFLLAVSNGDASMPIQCYKVSVIKSEEKCTIQSQSLPSFFLSEAPKDGLMDQLTKDKKCLVSHIKWIMREDADSLVVAASSDKISSIQIWELREKSLPIHKAFGNNENLSFNTVLWKFQCRFQYNSKVTSLATNHLNLVNSTSSGYIVASFSDNTIHCLYRDSLKPIASTTLFTSMRYYDEPLSKQPRKSARICTTDMSWLGNVLLVVDSEDSLHLFKMPPQIDSATPLSVPYCTTILEYCLIGGLDWLDLMLVMRPNMLEAVCERFIESFNRQPPPVQQFYYVQYLCMKTSLYRFNINGQSKANDFTHFLMLLNISTAFKSLLRPSEMNSHEKSPADSLSSVIAEGQDVDKVLMHLEAKEFTVEPSTLQSLQQLIQWIADLTLNLLLKVPESRPAIGKSYELIKDVKALNILREMLVLIRIWGLLRPACLPVFIKSDANLDILALIFKHLSRLIQNVNDPDDALIDDCCQISSQVQVQPIQSIVHKIVLATPQLCHTSLPLQLEYNNEPDCLVYSADNNNAQTIDSIRHLYLGKTPRVVKQCSRCGVSSGVTLATQTAAIRAWDQRWTKSCQCGGLWRLQVKSGL